MLKAIKIFNLLDENDFVKKKLTLQRKYSCQQTLTYYDHAPPQGTPASAVHP